MKENEALEELKFIKKVIDDSKKVIIDNGTGYIMWGVLIVVGLLSTYFGILTKYYFAYSYNWIIVVATGWILSYFISKKNRASHTTRTFASKIIGSVWLAAGITLTLTGFVPYLSGAISGIYISALMAAVLGIPYFISGVIYDRTWIMCLSIPWWIGSVIMFIYPGLYTLPMMAGMIFLFQIIPGIILYMQFKKEIENVDRF